MSLNVVVKWAIFTSQEIDIRAKVVVLPLFGMSLTFFFDSHYLIEKRKINIYICGSSKSLIQNDFMRRFYDKRDAEDALEAMDGRMLDGRELRVQMARYGRPTSPQRRGGRDNRRDRDRRR